MRRPPISPLVSLSLVFAMAAEASDAPEYLDVETFMRVCVDPGGVPVAERRDLAVAAGGAVQPGAEPGRAHVVFRRAGKPDVDVLIAEGTCRMTSSSGSLGQFAVALEGRRRAMVGRGDELLAVSPTRGKPGEAFRFDIRPKEGEPLSIEMFKAGDPGGTPVVAFETAYGPPAAPAAGALGWQVVPAQQGAVAYNTSTIGPAKDAGARRLMVASYSISPRQDGPVTYNFQFMLAEFDCRAPRIAPLAFTWYDDGGKFVDARTLPADAEREWFDVASDASWNTLRQVACTGRGISGSRPAGGTLDQAQAALRAAAMAPPPGG